MNRLTSLANEAFCRSSAAFGRSRLQSGMTLIELLCVLIVLIALAALAYRGYIIHNR